MKYKDLTPTISITRGDTKVFKFQRKNDEGIIETKATKLYFTVKENANKKEFLFQKSLDNGITFSEEDFYYRIIIYPTDTNNLLYGKYKYDIEVKENDYVKTLDLGNFIVTEEVTFAENEVK